MNLLIEEKEEAYRVTVTFPKKDAEWMQGQVDEGEYTSIAEVVRECVRNYRTGGRRGGIRIPVGLGQEVVIPTEIAGEQPDSARASLAEALSNQVRIEILNKLEKDSKYASDLEELFDLSYGRLMYHLKVLKRSGLIRQEQDNGKYIITLGGRAALIYLTVLASIIQTTASDLAL